MATQLSLTLHKRHLVADSILHRALSSLDGVEAAVVPAFHTPSDAEADAMAAVNEARAKLRCARELLGMGGQHGHSDAGEHR